MRRIAIMQPYYFPYLGYWQLMGSVDVFVIFDDVNYIKRGWINRNLIRLSNGEIAYIRLPVSKVSQNRLICEHELSSFDEAAVKVFKTLDYNYKKRPYFEGCMEVVKEVFDTDVRNLAAFLSRQIEILSRYFRFDTKIVRSSELDNNKSLSAQEKIIDIVKLLDGDVYINSSGGRELYDPAAFQREGIELMFLEPSLPEYDQGFPDFVPSLSVLDILMNCCQDEVAAMGRHHELVNPMAFE
ncbi:WbqC family protein [Collinsella tanakaei]|nr:WbqC family protein [Collinsella tanakaei]